MKKFMQGLLVNFALVVLCVCIISAFFHNRWTVSIFILELLAATIVIRLLQLLTNKFDSRYPILEHLLEFGMALVVVLGFGWLFKWYEDVWWLIIIISMVIIIYVGVYALGVGRIKRDVAYINEQIALRKKGY